MREDNPVKSSDVYELQYDIKTYLKNLEEISKLIGQKIDNLENENRYLKENNKMLKYEFDKKNNDYIELRKREDAVLSEYIQILEKLKDMEAKYIKEQKKASLIEIENFKSMEELESLRKEHNELLANADKNKSSLINVLKSLLK